jgi:outer membrane lipoprotein carrier protein
MRKKLIGMCAVAAIAWSGMAGAEDVTGVVNKVQAKYEKIKDYKAKFSQKALYKSLGKEQVNEGSVFFKKPGKMRWHYNKPQEQEIVSDGVTIWYYDPGEKQVMVDQLARAFKSRTPTSFLAGMGNLTKDFNPSAAKGKFDDMETRLYVQLDPKTKDPELTGSRLVIGINKKTFMVEKTIIEDKVGNVTTVTFSDVTADSSIPEDTFKFVVPRGVEVVRPPGGR